MITESFLLGLGFERLGNTSLPDWYNIFEAEPKLEDAPAFQFCGRDIAITIYLTPKGVIAESCSADEYREGLSYSLLKILKM